MSVLIVSVGIGVLVVAAFYANSEGEGMPDLVNSKPVPALPVIPVELPAVLDALKNVPRSLRGYEPDEVNKFFEKATIEGITFTQLAEANFPLTADKKYGYDTNYVDELIRRLGESLSPDSTSFLPSDSLTEPPTLSKEPLDSWSY